MTFDERIDRLTERHEALTQNVELISHEMQDVSKKMGELTDKMKELAVSQKKTNRFVDDVAEAVARLANVARDHEDRLGQLGTQGLIDRLRAFVPSWFKGFGPGRTQKGIGTHHV